tara:strand:+ start:2591 stop:2761 length:171 start_codon:yes stop_codon:yes gene_type:complete
MTEEIIINEWHDNQDCDYISECIQAELIDRGYFVHNVESFSWNVSVTISFVEDEDE